jgi:phenylalanyl-tRNA synthetase beta chain
VPELPEPGGEPAASAVRGRAGEQRQIEALAARLPAIVLHNPLSGELEALRLTLMAGLLATLRENSKHSDAGLWLFELGRRYLPAPGLKEGTGLAEERRSLGVALMGPLALGWEDADRPADFFDLKGVVETLLSALKIGAYRIVPAHHPTFHPGRTAALEVTVPAAPQGAPGGATPTLAPVWVRAGVLGEVHPEVAARFDLGQPPYLMELDLERIFAAASVVVEYSPLARFPAVQRDLAIVVDQAVPEGDVASAIREAGGDLVRRLRLFDVYTGDAIPAGKKSLAYALAYQSPERTLTDGEVDAVQRRIVEVLCQRLDATLRG